VPLVRTHVKIRREMERCQDNAPCWMFDEGGLPFRDGNSHRGRLAKLGSQCGMAEFFQPIREDVPRCEPLRRGLLSSVEQLREGRHHFISARDGRGLLQRSFVAVQAFDEPSGDPKVEKDTEQDPPALRRRHLALSPAFRTGSTETSRQLTRAAAQAAIWSW